jgi:multisubunit Na+/H+ antiporter MnhF subunit
VLPDEFTGYFTAAPTAAGALIGLLAIAISVRPEAVLAAEGPPAARAIAASAFTALVSSFFVSLIALIPGTRLGYIAIIMALVSLVSTWQTRSHLARGSRGRSRRASHPG